MYLHTNYHDIYGRIMQFNKNKKIPVHRWYPFVEGYSKEFIDSIIKEMGRTDLVCLEPFSGSGTTALELQDNGIPCFAFEVNPLMYLISKVKLETNYDVLKIDYWLDYVKKTRVNYKIVLDSKFPTLYQSEKRKKWNYNTDVGVAIEKIKLAVMSISDEIYRDLFNVALASILLEVSNLYRNGKCLSYKKDWENRKISEEDVFTRFDQKIVTEIREDVKGITHRKVAQNNKILLFNLDSRSGIETEVKDSSIDLVITSPPYLNSRDYTDTYMLELKTMGFTDSNSAVRNLREKTVRSHVQIKWDDNTTINNKLLIETLKQLEHASKEISTWNESIIDMVRLYFVDMDRIFEVLYKKMKKGGRVYFNVSNSAYFNVEINTLEICASIAEEKGFSVREIRDARWLKTSPQQKDTIKNLLEGVIVLER